MATQLQEQLQIANDPNSPQEQLSALAQQEDDEIQRAIAQNPNAPLEVLLSLGERFPEESAKNPSLSLFLLESPQKLREMPNQTALAFAAHPKTPDWLLSLLLDHQEASVGRAIVKRPQLSRRLLACLARSRDIDIQARLVEHPQITEEILLRLASHENRTVRLFTVRSSYATSAVLLQLSKDSDPQVSEGARWRLQPPRLPQKPMVSLRHAGLTEVGPKRSHNEDAFGVHLEEERALFIVADGMGGYSSGEIAALTAIQALTSYLRQSEEGAPAWRLLHHAFLSANQEIERMQQERGATATGSGTTLLALLIEGQTATIAHAGECRAYLLRGASLKALTLDHTLYNEFRHFSLEPPAEQYKSVVVRAVGGSRSFCIPDLQEVALEAKDLFLLCSDGITRELGDDQIGVILCASATLEEKARTLVQAASQAGGNDNLTALLVEVG